VKSGKIVIPIVLLMLLSSAAVRSEVVDRIIAVVNDEIITLREFNVAFVPYLKKIEESYSGAERETAIRQTREAFLQRQIDSLLILQEARKAKISVKDEEIIEVLENSLSRQNVSMAEFQKKLAQENSSLDLVKEEIRGQIARSKLMRREIRAKVVISEQEIGEYYQKHRDEYEGKEAVRLFQALFVVPREADKATKEKIKQEVNLIRKRAAEGEPLELIISSHLQKTSTAIQAGDIGFIEKGVAIPEVEKEAFGLSINQVSSVIESPLGFHILKVVDKKGAGVKPMETIREEIKMKLEEEKLEKSYDEWIAALRKKAHIEIR